MTEVWTETSELRPAAAGQPLRMIVGLARAIAQARTDPAAIVEATTRTLVQSFGHGSAAHLLAGLDVRAYAHRDLAAEEFLRDVFVGLPLELLPAGRVIATGRPLFHSYLPPEFIAGLPPELRAYLRKFALCGVIAVPIRAQDAVVGALSVWRDGGAAPFSDDDLNTVHVCAEHIGLAVEHTLTFRALQDREARFELAARATQEVLWDWDVATGDVWLSPAVHTTLGWSPEQVGTSVSWWLENIHDDDREGALRRLRELVETDPEQARWQYEYRFRRGDGSYAYISDRGFVQRDARDRLHRVVGSMQDVSERLAVTRRLARREESYRAFVVSSAEGIGCVEADEPIPIDLPPEQQVAQWYERGRVVECNDVLARMFGHEGADALREAPISALLAPGDPRLAELGRAFIASGYRLVDVETVERDRHGGERRFLYSLVGTVERGALHRAWGTRRDITELRRPAAALARYELLSQHGPDIILFLRADTGAIVEANDAAVAAYGYTRAELCARSIDALRAEGSGDEADAEGRLFEAVHRRKDGSTFPVEVSARAADVEGERLLVLVIRDIRERRRTEASARRRDASLQAVCDSTPELVFATDREGRLRFANRAARDVLGELEGDPLAPGAAGPGGREEDRRVLATGRPERFEERATSGRVFLSSRSPYRDEGGAVVGLVGVSMDITDRERDELRRRRALEALSRIQQAGRMGTWMLDPRTGATWLSPELEALLGRSGGDGQAAGADLFAAVHPDDREFLRRELAAAVAAGREFTVEFRVVRPGADEPGWLEARGRPEGDEHGRTNMVHGICIDIGERKRAELALRESEQLFARAFARHPNPMTVSRLPDCEYIEVNDAALQVGGFAREEMLGKTPVQLGIFVDPGDFDRFQRVLSERGAVRDYELQLRSKTGRLRTVLVSAELIEYRKQPCVLTVSVDISGRKQIEWALLESEERFRQIAATIHEAFWLMEFSPSWRFVYVSPGWEHTWRRAADELYADPTLWTRSVHPDDRAAVERSHQGLVTGAVDSLDLEYRVIRPDGGLQWIRDRGTLIRDADGRPWRAAGIAEDFTERKLAERERERLVSDLQVAIAVRDDFLSVASHELRTPLTALGFHLEHLVRLVDRGERDPEALGRKVGGAVRQIDRVTTLVDSLIHVSRMSLGRLSLELSQFDLVTLVRDVLARVGADALRARCELRLSAPDTFVGAWDRKQIDQAFYSLIANALKYGAGRPVDVRVLPGADGVIVEVQDRGIGIAEEDRPRIFDRFERAVSSAHYGGLGLGLYIARRIVEAHGGRLDVASAPGEGSTFRMQLPRRAAQA